MKDSEIQINNINEVLASMASSQHTYKSCIYDRTDDNGMKLKSNLYDTLSIEPVVMDAFINATCGLGTAASMNDDMKRKWLDQFTFDDVVMMWNNGMM